MEMSVLVNDCRRQLGKRLLEFLHVFAGIQKKSANKHPNMTFLSSALRLKKPHLHICERKVDRSQMWRSGSIITCKEADRRARFACLLVASFLDQ